MTHFKSVDINRLLAITLFWLLTLAYSPNLLGQRIIANNEAQNILYVGIANPVSICAESISCDQLKAYGNGKELKLESCKTVIIPDKKGTFVIEVFHKGGKIGDAYFRILTLPPPTIRIGTIENGKIKLKNIIAFGGIRAFVLANSVNIDVGISSYDIIIIKKNGDIFRLENRGPKFDEKSIDTFRQLTTGDKILICSIIGSVGDLNASIEPSEFLISE